ncbi:pitrilysin family protein [Ferrovibrio sp.]|uniref:M16 family metallopeptidase n=1 Tax=Ferrovibrio sp. TaxID=1917215 RepID=UPI001B7A3609|nr:pitrilysin family protein [Ferrovibrio sp.]MBP7065980.1 insulinase family protein [Ferrovibrio sp.]
MLRRVFIAALLVALLPLATLAGPKIERVVGASGVEAWLVREPKIPMIALQAVWRGGSASDPAGLEGRAELAAALLDEGAGDLAAEDFQAALRADAISLGAGVDRDYVTLNLRTLSERRDRAFALLAQMLTQPRFDAEPVARIKSQLLVAAQRALASPSSIANNRFMANAFPGHPYGRPAQASPESLERLGRDDAAAFIGGVLARRNLVIGVVGDITPEELKRLLDQSFGKLPLEPTLTLPQVAVPQVAPKPIVIPYANPQSIVLFGGRGLLRDDPDYYAATVLNYVLGGGGFNSRLTEEIREKRGLVYSVSTGMQPMPAAGLFAGSLSTRNDQVGQALALVREQLQAVARDGISETELTNAKAYLTGSFPLRLSSNAAIAGMLSAMQLANLGMDYIDRYPDYINAVTAADIRRVAERLFASGDLLVVVVGEPVGLGG